MLIAYTGKMIRSDGTIILRTELIELLHELGHTPISTVTPLDRIANLLLVGDRPHDRETAKMQAARRNGVIMMPIREWLENQANENLSNAAAAIVFGPNHPIAAFLLRAVNTMNSLAQVRTRRKEPKKPGRLRLRKHKPPTTDQVV